MQISRHWRLNAQRYRLEGFRTSDGTLSLSGSYSRGKEAGPIVKPEIKTDTETRVTGVLVQAVVNSVEGGEQHAA